MPKHPLRPPYINHTFAKLEFTTRATSVWCPPHASQASSTPTIHLQSLNSRIFSLIGAGAGAGGQLNQVFWHAEDGCSQQPRPSSTASLPDDMRPIRIHNQAVVRARADTRDYSVPGTSPMCV
jgi:hypothetical protein